MFSSVVGSLCRTTSGAGVVTAATTGRAISAAAGTAFFFCCWYFLSFLGVVPAQEVRYLYAESPKALII